MSVKVYPTIQYKSVLNQAATFDPFFQVKAVDDGKGIIQAYASKFGNEDSYGDIVVPGAYKRTLTNQRQAKRPYLYTYLFQHDPNFIIGGILTAEEDKDGLPYEAQCNLETQMGRECYSNAKMGVLYQSSIGYDIPSGGFEYKDGIRYLKEIRLWEISLVVFAANEEATVTDVKAANRVPELFTKTVCGNTSGAIGPRDESWDGAKAKGQIWDAATKSDGSLDTTLAKKYFMSVDGDAQQKGSYSYPFWYVGASPHICVGAVKAVANAIQGARGAVAPSGLKAKVETLYNHINTKYPNDTPLVAPWKDKGMTTHVQRKDTVQEQKTFQEHYAEEMCEDLLGDWGDVYLCALTDAVLDAFKIGDEPASDISDAIDAFKEQVMSLFVTQGIEYGLSQYLTDTSYCPADSTMQNGSDSPYGGWMASRRRLSRKAGRAISASNGDKIQSHIDTLHDVATKAMSDMKSHTKAIHTAADDLATVMQGSEPAYGTDPGTPAKGQQEGKAASPDEVRGAHTHPSDDTVSEQELQAALASLRTLHLNS